MWLSAKHFACLILSAVCGFILFSNIGRFAKKKTYVLQENNLLPEKNLTTDAVSKSSQNTSAKTNAVILLTNHRSGSSFIGKLFDQHKDVFYLFEPLFPLSTSYTCHLNNELKAAVTKNLTECNFPQWEKLMPKINQTARVPDTNPQLRFCIKQKICFRYNTKDLCSPKYCGNVKRPCYQCPPIQLPMAKEDCLNKKMIVLKIIRICDINLLKDSLSNPNVNVKIIHLIRDPRGICNSRKKVLPKVNITASIAKTCQRQITNYNIANIEQPDWLQGKYKSIRYEDMALHPFEMTRQLYEFIGLSFDDNIKSWIVNNTQQMDPKIIASIKDKSAMKKVKYTIESLYNQKDFLKLADYFFTMPQDMVNFAAQFYSILKNKKHLGDLGAYGTTRNSKAVVENWVESLDYPLVKSVESVCHEIMKVMNYTSVKNAASYQNKSISYIGDF